jgi:hypothetical protein
MGKHTLADSSELTDFSPPGYVVVGGKPLLPLPSLIHSDITIVAKLFPKVRFKISFTCQAFQTTVLILSKISGFSQITCKMSILCIHILGSFWASYE